MDIFKRNEQVKKRLKEMEEKNPKLKELAKKQEAKWLEQYAKSLFEYNRKEVRMMNPEPFKMNIPYLDKDMESVRLLALKKRKAAVEWLKEQINLITIEDKEKKLKWCNADGVLLQIDKAFPDLNNGGKKCKEE